MPSGQVRAEGGEVVDADRDVGVLVMAGWGSGPGGPAPGDPPAQRRSRQQFGHLGRLQGIPPAVERLEGVLVQAVDCPGEGIIHLASVP